MTQIYPSNSSVDMFAEQVKKIEKAWLYNTDEEDPSAINDLMHDLILEIEHFLRDYSMDMGN